MRGKISLDPVKKNLFHNTINRRIHKQMGAGQTKGATPSSMTAGQPLDITKPELVAQSSLQTAQAEGVESAINKVLNIPGLDDKTKRWLEIGKEYYLETKKSFNKAFIGMMIVVVFILLLLAGVVIATSITANNTKKA